MPTGLRREFVLKGILTRKQWSRVRKDAREQLIRLLVNDVRDHHLEKK